MKTNDIAVIFWDFDGVLLNSNAIRDWGFIKVLADFPQVEVNQLLDFHHKNGGLSRYVKFRYFFEKIRGECVTEDQIKEWAIRFSTTVLGELINPGLIIPETIAFVRNNYQNYQMHIVSGSDGAELNQVCKKLEIAKYFISIHGSPTSKTELINQLINKNNYNPKTCILIGDSINDFEASKSNLIHFMAYNNDKIAELSTSSIPLNA